MGKFRSKLKGQTKGKKWAKGQSSSSNPTTQKFRNLAKSNFFQENLGKINTSSLIITNYYTLSLTVLGFNITLASIYSQG